MASFLTAASVSDSGISMGGRKMLWVENMQARFAKGTFARIVRVLRPGEARTDFIREAVKRELHRREVAKVSAHNHASNSKKK